VNRFYQRAAPFRRRLSKTVDKNPEGECDQARQDGRNLLEVLEIGMTVEGEAKGSQ
jgi:hypothetical protein